MPVKVWVIPWYRELARAEAEAKVQESLGYNVARSL
jgi:hypothetical protein